MGPVLVLAGAGSGKTRVLTCRLAYLIEQALFKPQNILALTFTNKAAKEMQNRVDKLIGLRAKGIGLSAKPTMGTFHSVCARLLRKEIPALGYASGFVIFDSDDQLKAIKEICKELDLGKRFPPQLFRAYIGAAKNVLQTPESLNLPLEGKLLDLVREVYTRYQNFLFQQNALDFDDLLMLTVKIFEAQPKTLEKYQKRFAYILVDEYQDTNVAQYVLLRLLAGHRNLFVVGDDAQSIYGFRGSNIRNILNFEQDFPDSLVVKLEQNYRSTQNILAVAQQVIEINAEQKPKTLWTQNAPGLPVRLQETQDERAEAEFVAQAIVNLATGQELPAEKGEVLGQNPGSFSILDYFLKRQKKSAAPAPRVEQLPKKHQSLNDFCVLYRTHAQSRALEEALIGCGIPYQIVGGVKFYQRKEVKDLLAYLRLTLNYRDMVSLKRVINEPARGIGEKSYEIIKKFILAHGARFGNEGLPASKEESGIENYELGLVRFRENLKSIRLPPKQFAATQNFFWLLEDFSALNSEARLDSLMRLVFKKTGLEEWLNDGTQTGEMRQENVKELFNVAKKFGHLPWREALVGFLEEVALFTEADELAEKDAVTLMTLHSAKGLEFDSVFFVGLEEGILPHSRSLLDPSELAEEIRLAYVGLTRAKKRLILVYAKNRSVFGTFQAGVPSRILKVLPQENLQANIGNYDSVFSENNITYEETDFG